MKRKRVFYLLIFLVISISVSVWAYDFDLSKEGSIEILLKDPVDDNIIYSGKFNLYYVARAIVTNNNLSYEYLDSFSGCQSDLKNPDPGEILAYCKSRGIEPIARDAKEDGRIIFLKLETGLYLLEQKETLEGYQNAESFLVSIPLSEPTGMGWLYDVEAMPKLEGKLAPSSPEPTTGPDLIQTGQVKWPIPILSFLGSLLIIFGVVFLKRKKRLT